MSNNKQSSVEWLVKKLADLTFNYIAGFLTKKEYDTQCNKVIEQAVAMHKEEIIDFAMKFMMQDRPIISFYNETFGGNK